jgi:glycosidase
MNLPSLARNDWQRAATVPKHSCSALLLMAFLNAAVALASTTSEWHARKAPEWLKQATVYQVWLRSFSSEGTLKAVTARLPYLADLGVAFVYLSPFMKGPHPFEMSDYYAINPEHGTEEDLRALVTEAHRLKLKVMMDVVFYHSAPDNVLMRDPDNYMRNAEGKILLGYFALPRLNFENPKLRAYLIANLVHWVKDFGVDGFRCDVSGGVPLTFWEEARETLDAVKSDLILLAECDMPEEQLNAFDISYNYPFYYFPLVAVMTKGEPASSVREHWQQARAAFPQGARFLHFSDNHDQPRAVLSFGQKGALAVAVLNFTLDGIPFVYNGQEVGDPAPTAWQADPRSVISLPPTIDAAAPNGDDETWSTFRRLFQMRKEEIALTSGEVVWISNTHPQSVLSFVRRKSAKEDAGTPVYDWPNKPVPLLNQGDEEILVVINLSNRKLTTVVDLPWADYKPMQDLINKDRQVRVPIQESKLVFNLAAFEFVVTKRLPPKTIEPGTTPAK